MHRRQWSVVSLDTCLGTDCSQGRGPTYAEHAGVTRITVDLAKGSHLVGETAAEKVRVIEDAHKDYLEVAGRFL